MYIHQCLKIKILQEQKLKIQNAQKETFKKIEKNQKETNNFDNLFSFSELLSIIFCIFIEQNNHFYRRIFSCFIFC